MMAVLLCFGIVPSNAFAAEYEYDGYISMIDYNGRGYSLSSSLPAPFGGYSTDKFTELRINDLTAFRTAYCIQLGVATHTGIGYDQSDDYAALTTEQKAMINTALTLGYNVETGTKYGGSAMDEYIATQILIWLIAHGQLGTGYENQIVNEITANSPAAKTIFQKLRENVVTYHTVPSFATDNPSAVGAYTHDLKYNEDTGKNETTLVDENNVLKDFSVSYPGVDFSISGNKLHVSTDKKEFGTITAEKELPSSIVWNSVSMENGKKYRSNEKTYVTGVRKISDELCVKHRLSVIHTEKSERVARPYALWLAEQNGTYTWKTPIQKDIEEAIAASLTWKQFLRVMEKQGYAFRFDRKYATMILPGTGRTVRFKTLGKNYTPEAIQNRILYPKPPHRAGKQTPPASRFLILLGEKPPRRISGLRALYYSYLYKMGALPKKPRYPSFAVRQDIRKLDQRIEQAEFIFKNHIEDRGRLRAIRQKAEDEIAVLLKERQKLYRYQPDSPQIGVLTEELKKLRHTVKLCRNNARNELAELLPELGITSEQATEANEYLTNTENKLNGTAPQSKLKGVFGMFKK